MKIRFGPFILDRNTRQLTQDGGETKLTPKAFELLMILAQDRPNVLSKDELQHRLWPDTFVAEANLSNLIAEVRQALGDHARTPRYIRTAHGFGYAFCAEAVAVTADSPDLLQPVCWLEWGQRRFPLGIGEHVLGRDPDVEIRLDATMVSRRHARLLVTAERIVLEDFGSKNGTYRGTDRVTSPVQLADGDVLRLGSVVLTFRIRGASGTTDTQVETSA